MIERTNYLVYGEATTWEVTMTCIGSHQSDKQDTIAKKFAS